MINVDQVHTVDWTFAVEPLVKISFLMMITVHFSVSECGRMISIQEKPNV